MPTPTRLTSVATLDLALHAQLRGGVRLETIGDLRDFLTIADLPDSLPIEGLFGDGLIARYYPAIDPTDATPCGGYHAYLALTDVADVDPDAPSHPPFARVLDQALAYVPPPHAALPLGVCLLDLIVLGPVTIVVCWDDAGHVEIRPTNGTDHAIADAAQHLVCNYLLLAPDQRVCVLTDQRRPWSRLRVAPPHRHQVVESTDLPAAVRRFALATQEAAA